MHRLLLLSWMVLMSCFTAAYAQTVTGTVLDTDGISLIGASVLVQGTTTGTVTDIDGNFTLNVPQNAENLIVSYTGFATQTVPLVPGKTTYSISLENGAIALQDVVVTGYTNQARGRLTTSIASINSEDIAGQPVTSFTDALQGRLPGVSISSNAGTLGAQSSILVRGIGSINADTQPLYVIDGVIMETDAEGSALGGPGTSPLNNINPNDIESIDILKDAASAAVYGSRGANGVVLITTKAGNYNQPARISINQMVGTSEPTKQYDLLTGPEYARYWNQAFLAGGGSPTSTDLYANPDEEPNADWIDQVTRRGSVAETNISLQGGTSDLTYYMSGNYRDEKGWTKGTSLQRYAFNLKLEQRLGEKFKVGLKLNPSRTDNTRQNEDNNVASPQTYAALGFPNLDPFDENGEVRGGILRTSTGRAQFAGSPLINIQDQDISLVTNQVVSQIYGTVTPITGLTLRSAFGVQLLNLRDNQRAGVLTTDGFGSGGTGAAVYQEFLDYTFTNSATYEFDLGESNFLILGVIEANRKSSTNFFAEGNTFADDRLLTLNSAAEITGGGGAETEANFLGYLGQVNYRIGELTVQGSARYDGSSRFGADNQYGFFPAISAAYDFSRLIATPEINQLKLRASYGKAGNAGIGNFSSRGLVQFGNDYAGVPGFQLDQLANPDLTWEEASTFDVAIDYELFNRFVTGTVGYYHRTTSQLLFDVPLPLTTGIGAGDPNSSITLNAGEIVNKGVEFSANFALINKADLQWTFNLNGYTNNNEVTELVDNNGDGEPDDIVTGQQIVRVGESINSWYLTEYVGVNPDNGDALFVNAEGETSSTYQEGDARGIRGVAVPTFEGGFGSNIRFKGLDFSFFFQAATGHSLYLSEGRFVSNNLGATWNQTRDQLNSWREDNRDTDIPEARRRQNGGQHSTRYLSKADFLRLRNVQIGYTFSDLNSKGASLRLYATGQNLLTFTDFAGLDPESSGNDVNSALRGNLFFSRPQSRFVSFGLNLTL